jgi:urease accessory protein
MTVIERVYRERDLPAAALGFARDTVTLGWEERTRAHALRRSDHGVEFGTSLPRGTVLQGGDCLVLDEERLVIAVAERLEPVFVVAPRSASEWALFAYHIGNRHQPLMITDEALVCPEAPGVEQVLQQHHMPYTRATRAFTPATAVAGHSH